MVHNLPSSFDLKVGLTRAGASSSEAHSDISDASETPEDDILYVCGFALKFFSQDSVTKISRLIIFSFPTRH
jgi:hypothetical protein